MRSVLFTIPLNARLDLGPLGKVPVFGTGLLLAVWVVLGVTAAALHVRRYGAKQLGVFPIVIWFAIAAAIVKAGDFKELPIYGFGTMLFLGFFASTTWAARRIRDAGGDVEIAWDAAMWIFATGILGGRLFYVAEYPDKFFGLDPVTKHPRTLGQILWALIYLPDGGLVLYGGLFVTPIAYYLFCRWRGVRPLALGDIVISSVFLGLAFGRIGCLMHGCCFGDVCTVPWGVTFPEGSVPFRVLVARGLLSEDAARSLPLHPTQLYDAINAVLLALLTRAYYPFRRRSGEVLTLGWIAYPLNRFLIEFLRSDEPGQFGTMLTISQWVSLGLFATGVAFLIWLRRQPAGKAPLMIPQR